MDLNNDDILILNAELFLCIRKYVRYNKPSAERIVNLDRILKAGADINACDKNDSNNTVLHIAAEKGDKDIVRHLLRRGAESYKNNNQKTPLDLAFQRNTTHGTKISEILGGVDNIRIANVNSKYQPEKLCQKLKDISITTASDEEMFFSKRKGTSGISGQFYETKLLSLVLHRALHDQDIQNFYLAANMNDIGDFDDVCFRFNDVACFIQTKHKENTDKAKLSVANVRNSTSEFGLGTYFESFLKIRQRFTMNSNDPIFQGTFEETDTYFVFYTPLKENFDRKLLDNKQKCDKLHKIIYTGTKETNVKNVFQFDYETCDLDFLTTFIRKKYLKKLAKDFLEFILSGKVMKDMMTNNLIKIYHPALASQVIKIRMVSETTQYPNDSTSQSQIAKNNTGSKNPTYEGRFRAEFFDSCDPNLHILKDMFCQEIVWNHSSKTNRSKEELIQIIENICVYTGPVSISYIIGSPVTFDRDRCILTLDTSKLPKTEYKKNDIQEINYLLQQIQVNHKMITDAVHLAGENRLENLVFQLPPCFGNTDLTINKKSKEDVQARLNFLADKFYILIKHFSHRNKNRPSNVIDLSKDVVGPGKILEFSHLSSNGGIGGTVGNLLQFDEQSQYYTFNTKCNLGDNAKYVLKRLQSLLDDDVTNYKINVLIDGFPRLTFDTYKYDKSIANLFLTKLWYYTNQAQEEVVESILKEEISIQYNAEKRKNRFLFHVHSDAIFLRLHDEILKWWKSPTDVPYLTKRTTIFENAKKDIVDNPLLTVLNAMVIKKIKAIAVEFNAKAIDCLNLNHFIGNNKTQILNIFSDAVLLSAAKIMQSRQYNKMCTFLNLGYIEILPNEERTIMMQELVRVEYLTLVIICETSVIQSLHDTLLEILKIFRNSSNKHVIIITNEPISIKNIDVYSLKDSYINFMNLSSQSQKYVVDKYAVIFQGRKVELNKLLDEDSKGIIHSKLLWSFINKDKIIVGHKIDTIKYKENENCYIDRILERNGKEYKISTLNDLNRQIVIISSNRRVGKSSLLTHLSLATKKADPRLWIVEINLLNHKQDIKRLTQNKGTNNIMAFLCKVALNKPDDIQKVTFTRIDQAKIAIDCKDTSNDVSFELKLFIHYFNSGNVIFLFDDFEKIYPDCTKEAIQLFAALGEVKKRMWITSDCIVNKIIEDKLGASYQLKELTPPPTLEMIKAKKGMHIHPISAPRNYIYRINNYDNDNDN